jgi:hypothetical protein
LKAALSKAAEEIPSTSSLCEIQIVFDINIVKDLNNWGY